MARAQGARAQMALALRRFTAPRPSVGYPADALCQHNARLGTAAAGLRTAGLWPRSAGPDQGCGHRRRRCRGPDRCREPSGFWLKAAFGQPVTTGTTPKTHTFQSGNWTLPSMAIETAMPEVPRFAMYSGCVLRSADLADAAVGPADRDRPAGRAGRNHRGRHGRRHADGAGACSASAISTARSSATARRLGNVVSAEITYSNNLDRIETIRGDGRIDGADPAMAALTGRIEVRFADSTLITQAIDGTPCELEFAYEPRGQRQLHLHRPRRLPAAPAHRDRRAAGRAGHLRLAGRQGHQPRPHVHRRPRQHRCRILIMIRLNLTATPAWLDLAPGLRLLVGPLTTALMVSARADPAIEALPEAATPGGTGPRHGQSRRPPRRAGLGGRGR